MSFHYREGQLYSENVPVEQIAGQVGTPFYCYSSDMIGQRFRAWRDHFSPAGGTVCYAVKANSNQSILRLLAGLGAGADVVSGGELKRAVAAGIAPQRIVFSGVGKTEEDMRLALGHGILQFNVESEPELERLDEVAHSLGMKAPVALRINPDIDARTHRKITTGKSENKFGVPATRAREIYARAAELDGITVQGIDMHIGSQLTRLEPFEEAFHCLAELTGTLRGDGHDISVLDLGGGLGISYDDGGPSPPSLEQYASLAHSILDPLGCRLVVEPGRSIVGEAGILVSKVIYTKQGEEREFLILDAGMNDLLRPSLYDAVHGIVPVRQDHVALRRYDVVGPICETGDTFVKGKELPPMRPGDLVAIESAGAYGAVMGSFYNTHPLAPEVLVEGAAFRVVRERVTAEQIIGLDC